MKKLGLFMSLLAVIAVCGCIKATEVVTLNKDGSGSVTFTYGMKEENIQQLKAMSEMNQEGEGEMSMDADAFEFDEQKVRDQFKELEDEGITLKDVSSKTEDGWQYMTVAFDFKNFDSLENADTPLEGFSLSKDAAGNYVFTSGGGGEAPEMTDEEKQQAQMMAAMFAGMKIDIRINTPGKVIETNAPIKGADYAQWVYDIDADPMALTRMETEGMRLVFSGQGVDIPTFSAADVEVVEEEVVED